MSRVEIDAAGRRVTIDHDGEIAHLAETAQRLWDHTASQDKPGPAVGFTAERRGTRDTGETNGKWGRSFAPARAGFTGTDQQPPTSGE